MQSLLNYILLFNFFFQRYDLNLVIGLSQGGYCLCGYDYNIKVAQGGTYSTTNAVHA